MSGSNSDFVAAEFNEAIHFVMAMAAPISVADQAKFYFPREVDLEDAAAAGDGVPFLPSGEPDGATKAPVMVPCAIEGAPGSDENSNLGVIRSSRIVVTLLDADYQQVKGCSYVVVGGDRFDYKATDVPTGLFDAGVWTMHFTAFKDT